MVRSNLINFGKFAYTESSSFSSFLRCLQFTNMVNPIINHHKNDEFMAYGCLWHGAASHMKLWHRIPSDLVSPTAAKPAPPACRPAQGKMTWEQSCHSNMSDKWSGWCFETLPKIWKSVWMIILNICEKHVPKQQAVVAFLNNRQPFEGIEKWIPLVPIFVAYFQTDVYHSPERDFQQSRFSITGFTR